MFLPNAKCQVIHTFLSSVKALWATCCPMRAQVPWSSWLAQSKVSLRLTCLVPSPCGTSTFHWEPSGGLCWRHPCPPLSRKHCFVFGFSGCITSKVPWHCPFNMPFHFKCIYVLSVQAVTRQWALLQLQNIWRACTEEFIQQIIKCNFFT